MKINLQMYQIDKFKKVNEEYIYEQNINDDYYCKIIIKDDILTTKVYDSNTLEEYIPYNIKSNTGSHSKYLHDEVDKIVDSLKIYNNILTELDCFVKNKYNVIPEIPFKNDSVSKVYKKNNGKWFILSMNIPYKSLGQENDFRVNIINVKLQKELIPTLIDNVIFYKAYHMNKKHWITINLDNIKSIKEIEKYIDISYNLV